MHLKRKYASGIIMISGSGTTTVNFGQLVAGFLFAGIIAEVSDPSRDALTTSTF
jgi:hypothetical protein